MNSTTRQLNLNRRQQRQQRTLLPLFAPVQIIALPLIALVCAKAKADCYFDPFTGRQVCTQPNYGWPSSKSTTTRIGDASTAVDASAHCRVVVGDGSTGSGTLVAKDEAIGLVLTCSHLFDDSSAQIIVSFPSGQRFTARLLDRDTAHDLAALAIRRPDVEPIAVSEENPGDVLLACGFGPNGLFRAVRGAVTGRATAIGAVHPSLTIRGAVRPGDSGGGVLGAAGQLVGVVWGQREGLTYATCGQPVREFLDRVSSSRIARKRPSADEGAPQSAGVGDAPTRAPEIDWRTWSSEIETRISALDDKKQDKGDYLQPGDLNGYQRVADAPKFDNSQFARRAETDSRLKSLSARVKTFHSRVESFEQHIKQVAASKVGFFQGLSFGKLLVGALGLSGPLAAAVIVAGGVAGRQLKRRGAWSKEQGAKDLLLAPGSPLSAPLPIAIDSPPLPQRTVPETHYVPFEKDSFSKAHQWASEQVARKYPGATEVLQAQDSLIKQFLNAQ